jgi:hypothetical protein
MYFSSNGADHASFQKVNLLTILSNIHKDPGWWHKVLIGGGLMLTIVGYPWAAGLVMESMENTRKGFPTPLPPWREWSSRYLIGLFAVLIDIIFFVLPLFVCGVLFFCVGVSTVVSGNGRLGALVIVGAIALPLYELAMFASSVSVVGRLIYAEEGHAEDALGGQSLRAALRPGARAIYGRARLQSLAAYLPVLLLALACWFVFPIAWPAGLLLLWLASSALLYAHLAVGQLYATTDRMARSL